MRLLDSHLEDCLTLLKSAQKLLDLYRKETKVRDKAQHAHGLHADITIALDQLAELHVYSGNLKEKALKELKNANASHTDY